MKQLMLLSLAALTFTSCNEEMNIDYVINNQTEGTIRVSGKNQISNENFDYEIPARESMVITNFDEKAKTVCDPGPYEIFGEDLEIINESNKAYQEDYQDVNYWQTTKIQDGDKSIRNYELRIYKNDF